MKDTEYIEKYLTQKKFTAFDIICTVVCAAAFIWALFFKNGIPIGVPLLFVSAVCLLFSRSRQVKDVHFDAALKRFLDKNNIIVDGANVISVYDLNRSRIKKGKDGVVRTDRYVVTKVELADKETRLFVNTFNLIEGTVEMKRYCVSEEQKVVLSVNNEKTSVGVLETAVLKCDAFEESIPVSVNDYNAEQLVRRICD